MKRIIRKIYYAFLLARKGGLLILFRLFWSRVYSKTNYIWLAMELGSERSIHSPRISYSLQPAAPGAFRKMLDGLNKESGQDVFEILRRVSFYRRGFDTCYLALTDSGKVCHMSWLLSSRHNELIRTQFPSGMRGLEEDEVFTDHGFTFAQYRNKGLLTSVLLDLANIARNQGFRRMIAYVDITNRASLKACHRAGFRPYDEEQEFRRFFRIWRREQA